VTVVRAISRTLAGLLATLVLAGMVFEYRASEREERDLNGIGTRVNAGHFDLNLSCVGEDSPTVILEAGAGLPGYAWIAVQHEIAPRQKTRLMSAPILCIIRFAEVGLS
jgi:hypothetical protein